MKTKLPEIARDAAVVAGAISVVVGLWLVTPAVALIVGGVLLAGIGIAWEMDILRRKNDDEKNRRRGF